MKNKFSFIVFLLPICISSCISFQRNIKLNYDGSGSELLIVHLDKNFFEAMYSKGKRIDEQLGFEDLKYKNLFPTESFSEVYNDTAYLTGLYRTIYLSNPDNISVIDYKEKIFPDTSKDLEINYKFKNVTKLNDEFLRMFKEDWDDTKSKLNVEFIKNDDTISFQYTLYSINSTGYVMNDSIRKNAEDKFGKIFEGNYLIVNLEFDNSVISTNANLTNGKILTWKIPMNLFLLDPIELNAKYKND